MAVMKGKCKFCFKNKVVSKWGDYCCVCHRKRKIPGYCFRCGKFKPLIASYCAPCYNYRSSTRAKALKFYGSKCTNRKCIIKKLVKIPEKMLDVDHIKGRVSDDISNLQVLCVWCHALKTRGVNNLA